jgi:PAS domain S-box-containing protein
MLHAVYIVDVATLHIIAANRLAGDLLGMPAQELVGRPALELAATPQDLCFWDDVAHGASHAIESHTWVHRCDGGTAPVTRRVTKVEAADGAAVYVVALHDRSEQVRVERDLEATAAELAATLESIDDGILVTDLAGRIRNFNRRFADIWALPQGLRLHRDDDAVFDWMRRAVADPSAYMRRLAEFDEATLLQASDRLTLLSGRVLERATLPQCSRGSAIGRVFSFRDVTRDVAPT